MVDDIVERLSEVEALRAERDALAARVQYLEGTLREIDSLSKQYLSNSGVKAAGNIARHGLHKVVQEIKTNTGESK